MRLRLNMVVFRVQDRANARLMLQKAGFEPREILVRVKPLPRVSRFVLYKGHGLAVSVKENHAVAQPESLDQTFCFPEQTPDFIKILEALKGYLVPEHIAFVIEKEEKGVFSSWCSILSTLSKKGFKTGKYGIGLMLSGKEIRIECFSSLGMWVISFDHVKSPSPRRFGEGFPMNIEAIKKAINWLCQSI